MTVADDQLSEDCAKLSEDCAKLSEDCAKLGECRRAYSGPMPGCEGICLNRSAEVAHQIATGPLGAPPATEKITAKPLAVGDRVRLREPATVDSALVAAMLDQRQLLLANEEHMDALLAKVTAERDAARAEAEHRKVLVINACRRNVKYLACVEKAKTELALTLKTVSILAKESSEGWLRLESALTDLDKVTAERDAALGDADREHARAVELADKLRAATRNPADPADDAAWPLPEGWRWSGRVARHPDGAMAYIKAGCLKTNTSPPTSVVRILLAREAGQA